MEQARRGRQSARDFPEDSAIGHRTENDALYLVDTASHSVRRIAPVEHQLVVNVSWSRDGKRLWLQLFDNSWEQVDVKTGKREPRAANAHPDFDQLSRSRGARPRRCTKGPERGYRLVPRGFGGDLGIDLVAPDGHRRHLVVIKGRTRGFNDYLPTITPIFFSRSCRQVIFGFHRTIWEADVPTGKVSALIDGDDAFALPNQ